MVTQSSQVLGDFFIMGKQELEQLSKEELIKVVQNLDQLTRSLSESHNSLIRQMNLMVASYQLEISRISSYRFL